jgi:hypothetical protein
MREGELQRVNWVDVQDADQWRVLVNMAINFGFYE